MLIRGKGPDETGLSHTKPADVVQVSFDMRKLAELGRSLAATLGGGALCHVQGHGIVSAAADIQTAAVAAVALEQLADANLRILQTGRAPRVITPRELAELAAAAPIGGRWAYYVQLLEEEEPQQQEL